MGRLFEQRERAAEGLFAHEEEALFVARRRSVEALALWAGESMALNEGGLSSYRDRLVDAFIGGTHENAIVMDVQRDLERAGKPSLVEQAGPVLDQALAEATLLAHPRPVTPAAALHHRTPSHGPKKPTFGWSL